jgi:hypothetical protein
VNDKATISFAETAGWPHLPLQERIADKLGDILYASDEILDMIRCGRAEQVPSEILLAVERLMSTVYHQVNDAMKGITD